jgi:hypothetical protein
MKKILFLGALLAVLAGSARMVLAQSTACTSGTQTGTCQSLCPASTTAISGVAICSGLFCCVATTTTTAGASTISFTNPVAFDTVEGFLTAVLGALRTIIATLAVLAIVIGGVLYIVSAGNEGMMKTAKAAITAAMIGLALALAGPSLLKEIYSVMQVNITNPDVLGALTLSQIALKVLAFLLSVIGVLTIVMMVIGGILYLTSAGDEDRANTGKKIVTYSIIGLAVALGALVIVRQIVALIS